MSEFESLRDTVSGVLRAVTEAQHLSDEYAKSLEVEHYGPDGLLAGFLAPRPRLQRLTIELDSGEEITVCQDGAGKMTSTVMPGRERKKNKATDDG